MQNLKQIFLMVFALLLIVSCKKATGDFKTANGYNYKVHTKGSGKTAAVKDFIFYTVTITADGDTLQSNTNLENLPSMQLPADWQTIKPPSPFYEVFSKVSVGDSLTIFVPTDSIPKGNPQIAGKKQLDFVIAIKDIKDSIAYDAFVAGKRKEMEAKAAKSKERLPMVEKTITESLAAYKANKLQLQTTASGLKYIVHQQGSGPVAKAGQIASVDYHGVLTNGTKIDSSFERGMPIEFPVGKGNVIKGWDEALLLLPEGTKATLFIPSTLGYGDQQSGPIPANSELVFYIEVQKVK